MIGQLTQMLDQIERERLTLVVHPTQETDVNQALDQMGYILRPIVTTSEWAVEPGQVLVFKGTKKFLGVD